MDIGRVFFDGDKPETLRTIWLVPLATHVGNVVRLVDQWKDNLYRAPADLSRTRDWLRRAAARHDEAKPRTFRVTYDPERGFGYSFRGHRFDVPDGNLYVELLIRLHHEFSVTGIVEAQAQLSEQERFRGVAGNFPLDLYTLEMCDNLAAEAENYAVRQNPSPRVFMEFHSERLSDGRVAVEPWPLRESPLTLPVELYPVQLDAALREIVCREAVPTARELPGLGEALRRWEPAATERREVTLCDATD